MLSYDFGGRMRMCSVVIPDYLGKDTAKADAIYEDISKKFRMSPDEGCKLLVEMLSLPEDYDFQPFFWEKGHRNWPAAVKISKSKIAV